MYTYWMLYSYFIFVIHQEEDTLPIFLVWIQKENLQYIASDSLKCAIDLKKEKRVLYYLYVQTIHVFFYRPIDIAFLIQVFRLYLTETCTITRIGTMHHGNLVIAIRIKVQVNAYSQYAILRSKLGPTQPNSSAIFCFLQYCAFYTCVGLVQLISLITRSTTN